jgi:diaminopimelate decarboxylase
LSDEVFVRAAQEFPTPFYLYDEAGIRQTARALNAAFAWAPSFREYFAVKALPNPRILEIFKQEGCGADCSSECELLLAERAGYAGDEIMFSANAMPPAEFEHARKLNAIVNLDDISDIDILAQHGGIPEEICVRYNPGGDFKLGNAIMGSPGDSKYGWTREQLPEGLKRLKALGAKRFALHAFLASNTTDPGYYPGLAGILFELGAALEKEVGLSLSFINLSGGVGIPYKPGGVPTDIAAVGEGVRKAYEKVFGDPAKAAVGIKTELGRYMTGPHGWLVTRAVHEKKIHKDYIGVDACASNLMRPAMYGAYHHIHICGKRDWPETETYDVTGCLCENNDKFAVDRKLPKVEMGDLLVIHDAGAHGFAMGYQYNGRLRSAEILYTQEDSFRMIRRAETPEDYFATLL